MTRLEVAAKAQILALTPEKISGVYGNDFQTWLFDFYPGLSWNPKDRGRELEILIKDPEVLAACQRIQGWSGFDLLADLKMALAEDWEDLEA